MKKHILVTGSHRSGSTWTGRVISQAKNIRYIDEPFNVSIKRKQLPFTYWFEYIENTNDSQNKKVENYLNSFFYINNTQYLSHFLSNFFKHPRITLGDLKNRLSNRSLIKDPIAIMSAEWIYKKYNTDVIVMIRHPAAFVASLKVQGWEFDFNDFLQQPKLIKTHLKRYEKDIECFSENKKDIIDQGILLWNIIHSVIYKYQVNYKEWIFVKHEELSRNPLIEFEKLFNQLNINFDNRVKKYLIESSTSISESDLKRDSIKNIKSWKTRLSSEEIKRIKEGTLEISSKFYSEKDW